MARGIDEIVDPRRALVRRRGLFPSFSLLSTVETNRFTIAFRAFVLLPSRASQFRRTASETEPANPMQKYSRRRWADSIGDNRVAGTPILHALCDSPGGLDDKERNGRTGRGARGPEFSSRSPADGTILGWVRTSSNVFALTPNQS